MRSLTAAALVLAGAGCGNGSTGAAPFTTATYRGAPSGTAVQNGIVTFRQSGVVFNGRWRADW
jgi:electron transfer flavoprotein alpha/beta subunit